MPKIIDEADIFNAVIRVVVERGYEGATTQKIAWEAGVSEMTLFRKFESKAQLVVSAFMVVIDSMGFEEIIYYSGDLVEDLSRVVDHYQRMVEEYGPFMAVLLAEIPRYPELAGLLEKPFSVVRKIGEMVARYQDEGKLRQEPPLHVVASLMGPLIYSVMMQDAFPDDDLLPVNPSHHVTLFLEGYRM